MMPACLYFLIRDSVTFIKIAVFVHVFVTSIIKVTWFITWFTLQRIIRVFAGSSR